MDEWRSAIWITGATTRASLKISKIESRYSSVSRTGFFQSLTRLYRSARQRAGIKRRRRWVRNVDMINRWWQNMRERTRFGWELQTRRARRISKTRNWKFNFVLPYTRWEWRPSLGRYWKRRSCVRRFEWYGFSQSPRFQVIMLIILDQIILIVLGFFVVIESKSLLRLDFLRRCTFLDRRRFLLKCCYSIFPIILLRQRLTVRPNWSVAAFSRWKLSDCVTPYITSYLNKSRKSTGKKSSINIKIPVSVF